jgi:hypothetical protein
MTFGDVSSFMEYPAGLQRVLSAVVSISAHDLCSVAAI